MATFSIKHLCVVSSSLWHFCAKNAYSSPLVEETPPRTSGWLPLHHFSSCLLPFCMHYSGSKSGRNFRQGAEFIDKLLDQKHHENQKDFWPRDYSQGPSNVFSHQQYYILHIQYFPKLRWNRKNISETYNFLWSGCVLNPWSVMLQYVCVQIRQLTAWYDLLN